MTRHAIHVSMLAGVTALVGIFGAGCQEKGPATESATPGAQHLIPPRELAAVTDRAAKGEMQAIRKLISHYELAAPDLKQATRWQRAAADQGDVGAMLNLATYLGMQGSKESCAEAVALLHRAKVGSSDPELLRRANRKLETLRSGARGEGPCVKWLAPLN